MRVETNQKLVKRNTRIAQYLFFFSLGVLIVGFIVTNYQLFVINPGSTDELTMIALVLPSIALPIGLVTTLISVRMTNLWVRRPRPEDAIQDGLKGLSRKSVLYNYHHIPARHVLICPQGVFAIITRFQDGQFVVNGDKWKSRKGFATRILSIFRLDGLGDPARDAQEAAQYIQNRINPIAENVEVKPLVVFVDPRVSLEINEPTVPVLHASTKLKPNLTDYLRGLKDEAEPEDEPGIKRKKSKKLPKEMDMPLTSDQIEAFEAATLR